MTDSTDRPGRRTFRVAHGVFAAVAVALLTGVASAAAQSTTTAPTTTAPTTTAADSTAGPTTTAASDSGAGATDEQLAAGAAVFSTTCATCHQAEGAGVPGQYPRLKGNEKVQDAAYVRDTILKGRKGPLTSNGESFNGVMPPMSGLSDADIDAVIAYLQSDFAKPKGAVETPDPTAGLADGKLPGSINLITTLALLVGLGVGVLVMVPRLAAAHDRLETTWLDAWMKTGVIFVGIIVLVLLIPNWIVKMSWFGDLDGIVQDLLATAIWGAGLVTALWSLWYAHRRNWI